MKFLGMWVPRHTKPKRKLTYIAVRHADEDGARPHLHPVLHLPSHKHREALAAALYAIYGDSGVIEVVQASDKQALHASGYWGSTFDYVTRFKSQKAYRKQGGRSWRASRRDENGRHVGIKTPYEGRRWTCSHHLNPCRIAA